MDIIFLLLALFVILAAFIAITIMKKLLKIAFILGVIFLILFLITGGSIMNDFSRLKQRITDAPVMVLLGNDGELITGFVDSSSIELLSESRIAEIQELYDKGRMKDILGENYKLFIVDADKLTELRDIEINNKEVTSRQIVNYFINDEDIDTITYQDIALELGLAGGERNMKAGLFAYVYEKEIKITKNPLFFFRNYKEGRIIVYPETMFFRFTKIVPLAWIDEKLNKLKDTITEKVRESVKEAID